MPDGMSFMRRGGGASVRFSKQGQHEHCSQKSKAEGRTEVVMVIGK